jgi:hypothetical protein
MQLTSGDLVSLGHGLTSESRGFERPTLRTVPLAVLVYAGQDTALVVSTNAELLWVMRYRCGIQT